MAEMKPGDVRKFKGEDGRSLAVTFGIWAERKSKTHPIHIHLSGSGGNTTINNDPKSERYHRTLFRNLRRIMIKNNCWEFGDAGAETEVG
jgi:hypothetical protein